MCISVCMCDIYVYTWRSEANFGNWFSPTTLNSWDQHQVIRHDKHFYPPSSFPGPSLTLDVDAGALNPGPYAHLTY